MSTSLISTAKAPSKRTEEPILPSTRPIAKPKSRKRSNNGVDATNPRSLLRTEHTPLKTPRKQQEQQLPARTNTPLIDLVKRGQTTRIEPTGSNEEIPSTSELGTSPNTHRARTRGQRAAGTSSPLTALVTPRKKTWAGRTVKQEDEEGSVVTPGGTLRRCGLDEFVCGRAFCFKCRSEDSNFA